MAARLTWVTERINLEELGMARPVDTLSGLAPLLRVRPELQQLCRFGAQWCSDHWAGAGLTHRRPIHAIGVFESPAQSITR
jgi:hypothetical protein